MSITLELTATRGWRDGLFRQAQRLCHTTDLSAAFDQGNGQRGMQYCPLTSEDEYSGLPEPELLATIPDLD